METDGQVNQKLQSSGMLNYFLLFLLIGMILYGVFLNFEKGRVLANTDELEKQTLVLQDQIDTIKGNKVEVSQNASVALKLISQEEIRWSEVISEVEKLMPVDSSGRKKVEVLSYSGTGQGKVMLNMVTKPASLPPYDDVANIIAIFNSSVFFKDAYVPAISKSSEETGEITLSFMLNTDFQKPETGSDSLQLNTTTTDGGTAKVPRADTSKIPRNN
jgi:hypothetical protein